MCLALPAKVVDHDPQAETATVSLAGVRKEVSTVLVDDVEIDDYLLIHVGYALNKVSEAEAERTLKLLDEAGLLEEDY